MRYVAKQRPTIILWDKIMAKYKLRKLLLEYNKVGESDFSVNPRITNPVLTHSPNTFTITYSESGGSHNGSLTYFASYWIYPVPNVNNLKDFIRAKEKTKDTSLKIKILPSNKIRYAYLEDNYFTSTGSLGNSCMRHKANQKSLNFYVKNNVRIVVVTDSRNKIHARALLWDGVKSTDRKSSFTYLDRAYTESDLLFPMFRDLAAENEWKYYGSTSAGRGKRTYYIDNINIKGICYLPYADTFKYLFYKDTIIAASTERYINEIVTHHDTVGLATVSNGGYCRVIDPDSIKEVLTGNYMSKKDGIKVKRYKGYVLKENIANINGNYYSRFDNKVVESSLDGFLLKENSVNEVITNEVIDKTKAIHSPKYNGFIHKSHVLDIKGRLYHKNDNDIVCFRDKWYHISDCFINYNRKNRNAELAQKKYHFWIDNEVFVPSPKNPITRKENIVPKEHAIIAYNLVYNPLSDSIEYQEIYLSDECYKSTYIIMNTGEYILNRLSNKQYLKKFNNKWYIKKDFEAPNKKQLTLF